jgi:16S rRNA (guanine1207-N2)-methyltransferase
LSVVTEGVYGRPPHDLAEVAADAVQFSPLAPGAEALEALTPASLDRLVVASPPGAIESRYVLAQALRALRPGGDLVALAPKTKGGARLRKMLEAFGCAVDETARRHQRICHIVRPEVCEGLDEAIAAGALQIVPALGLWSQPGVFSWDRIDPGSAALLAATPAYSGRGADLGCGIGVLARAVLDSATVESLIGVDIDARAIAAARRNVEDPRASFVQVDLREAWDAPEDLDFVIMNPPFHDAGAEDRTLGQTFIRRAAALLHKGGTLRLVANIGMPYEAVLSECFRAVTPLGQTHGYKLFEARK